MPTTRLPRPAFVGPLPTARQRLETLLEPVRSHPFRDAMARELWCRCLDRLQSPQPVLDLSDFPVGLVMLLQPAWLRAHASMAVEAGMSVHEVRLAGVRRMPPWLVALPRLRRLVLQDCEASFLDLRHLVTLRQLQVLGSHRLRQVDIPHRTTPWIEPGHFHLDIHVHDPVVVTVRHLPARPAVPQTVRVHPDPGPGVDDRMNLQERVRTADGRVLGSADLVSLWSFDRRAHHTRVRDDEVGPEGFDYRSLATPELLQARAGQALALRPVLWPERGPVHLVADSCSGDWLCRQMDRMAAEGRTSSHHGLSSLHHAMGLELAIETDARAQGGPAVPRWVVRLYDPVHTTLHLEWFAHDRNDLRLLTIGGLHHALWPGPRAHTGRTPDPLWRLSPLGGEAVDEDWMPPDALLAPESIGQLFKAGRHARWRACLLRQHARRGDMALTLAFLEARDAQGHTLLARSPMSRPALQAYIDVLLGLGLQGVPLALTLARALGPEGETVDRVLYGLLSGRLPRLSLWMQALRRAPLAAADLVVVLRPPPRIDADGWAMPLHELLAEGRSAGNALNWRYTLALPVDGRVWEVQFDDWMYLMDERVMLNKARMSKFGIHLGEVTLSFVRRPS